MTDDRARDTGRDASSGDSGPPSLDPKSAGCIVPFAIAAAVLGLAWFGLQSVIGNTGKWSIEAARYGLGTSGLPSETKQPFLDQVDRLAAAYEGEEIGAQVVVEGVSGLLETRIIQLLVLDDIRARRLPASGLSEEERAAASATLEATAQCVDDGQIALPMLLDILGPLQQVPEDGSVVPLDDDGLRELVARADIVLEALEQPDDPAAVDAAALLDRYRTHVDETLASAASSGDAED